MPRPPPAAPFPFQTVRGSPGSSASSPRPGLGAAELEAAGQRDEPGAPSRPACQPGPGQREDPAAPSRSAGEPGPGQPEGRPRPPTCLSQMEASLTCAVCLSLFEEPVTLPLCSHNFCRACVLECLASASAARLQQQQRGQGQARLSRGGPGPGAGGGAAGARVSCPLCRKLCPLPRGGAAALPVNTTLAEVVKLYRSGAAGAAKAGETEQGPGPGLLSPLALGGTCQKHPSRPVQLYCRMCRQAGCGQCVSEEHQGIFHSVNLIDTVYQEEKVSAALPLQPQGSGWEVGLARRASRRARGALPQRGSEGVPCFEAGLRVSLWAPGVHLSPPAVRLHTPHTGHQAMLQHQQISTHFTKAPEEFEGLVTWLFFNIDLQSLMKKHTDAKSVLRI